MMCTTLFRCLPQLKQTLFALSSITLISGHLRRTIFQIFYEENLVLPLPGTFTLAWRCTITGKGALLSCKMSQRLPSKCGFSATRRQILWKFLFIISMHYRNLLKTNVISMSIKDCCATYSSFFTETRSIVPWVVLSNLIIFLCFYAIISKLLVRKKSKSPTKCVSRDITCYQCSPYYQVLM